MNILLVNHHRKFKSFARGYTFGKYLVKRYHNVTLVVISDNAKHGIKEYDWDGIRTIETPDLLWGEARSGWCPWNLLNRIYFLLKDKTRYDIIHALECRPATIYPCLMVRKYQKILLLTDWIDWWGRGGLIKEHRPLWYQFLFGGVETYHEEHFRSQADGLTVISHSLAKRAIVTLGVDKERIEWIPGGANLETFFPMNKCEIKAKYGINENSLVIGFSGMDVLSDLPLVFKAFAIIQQECPDSYLLLTGPDKNSIERTLCSYSIKREHIISPGRLPNLDQVNEYLNMADVFVLPFTNKISNLGRWPNKLGDYFAIGRPVVTNPVGEMEPFFNQHNVGLLADETPEDFAEKVIYLLRQSDLREELGHNCRRIAENELNWNTIIQRLESFYERTINMCSSPQTN